MAATAVARRLTEAHRQAQLRLGASTVAQLRRLFHYLDPRAVDATFEQWLAHVVPVVVTQRAASAQIASNYLRIFKVAELGVDAGDFALDVASIDLQGLATSLFVTGPVRIKTATGKGVPLSVIADYAEASTSAAGMRWALDGGRDLITDAVGADHQALGWARATSGKACAFCAMLASRGPVYSDDTVDFESHDGCSCTAEPVYRQDADWPAGARAYRAQWDEATKGAGLEPGDALNAFRKALA
ncbi:MAG: hypothetical protein Q8K63_05385 [Acidimicrobiales bacterium]|nr:hypothetical protein [Acidimicrobiales bacterium]